MKANIRVAVQALHRERFTARHRIDVLLRNGRPAGEAAPGDRRRHDRALRTLKNEIVKLDAAIRNVEQLG